MPWCLGTAYSDKKDACSFCFVEMISLCSLKLMAMLSAGIIGSSNATPVCVCVGGYLSLSVEARSLHGVFSSTLHIEQSVSTV